MKKRIRIKLREQLAERGMAQSKLAELTEIRPAAISNLTRGYVDRLTIDHIERIADVLGITDINELITLEASPVDAEKRPNREG
ncbi:helix-turn-helix transcriptional regulator [uncultured Planococcus sp.]|uniref:helix-turn-helix domain-containing protein n=1 Tax=uncultured Planococcus sp. TaxID=337815 RepID=UPI002630DB36|nr:helix-turn-helix transcriptional regulator [uncultured Planococcus sp.]